MLYGLCIIGAIFGVKTAVIQNQSLIYGGLIGFLAMLIPMGAIYLMGAWSRGRDYANNN